MKKEDLISVIVPIYNVEQYLEECINSIKNQTYKNLEIILVDDGSPDNCGKICDEYSEKDSRIKVIHKKNGGLSDSRNVGIQNSKGDYILFVDSDDYIDFSMIETLYNNIKENKADISICDFVKKGINTISYNNFHKKIFSVCGNEKFEYLYNEYNIVSVVQWNKLFKRKIFEEIKFEVGKVNEDEFIIFDEFDKANKISYILKPLYYYRQRENSIMNSKFNIKRYDAIEALEKRTEKLKNRNLKKLIILNYINIFNNLLGNKSKFISSKLEDKQRRIIENYDKKIKYYSKLILKENASLKIKFKIILYYIFPNYTIKIIKRRNS